MRPLAWWFAVGLFVAASSHTARAADSAVGWKGHLFLGYSRVFSDSLAPSGSLSVQGGVDYPITRRLRLGPTLTFHLLGSSDVTRGSITAGLDYSLVDAALELHVAVPRGPFSRVSTGPGVAGPRAALSVAAGGAGFEDVAVHGVASEWALDATIMPRRESIVTGGLQVGGRWVFRSGTDWKVLSIGGVVHY